MNYPIIQPSSHPDFAGVALLPGMHLVPFTRAFKGLRGFQMPQWSQVSGALEEVCEQPRDA